MPEAVSFTDHLREVTRRATIIRRAPLWAFTGADGADGLREILIAASRLLGTRLVLLGHVNASTYTTVAFYTSEGEPGIRRGDTIPIGETYCRQELTADAPFLLEDALADPNFARHAGFTRHGLRSYAGAPIELANGTLFGTLCGVDPDVRRFPGNAALGLTALARQAAKEIGRRLMAGPPLRV